VNLFFQRDPSITPVVNIIFVFISARIKKARFEGGYKCGYIYIRWGKDWDAVVVANEARMKRRAEI
jgi:hypothetical protein